MPSFHTFGPFTGQGQEYFTSPSNPTPIGMAYEVTDPGNAWSLDALDPHRYMKLGWVSLFDNYVSQSPVSDGDYLHKSFFLEYLKGWCEGQFANDASTGTSGFIYNLQEGVEVTFWWYY